MSNIGPWLEKHGLGKYTDLLVENEIDVDVLDQLTLDELKDLGIPLGARKRLLKAVAAGVESGPSDEPTQSASATVRTGEAEHRQLTVMFCDLVGSTALSESMDTEDYRDLLGAYQSAAAGALHEHEGYIARYMGDGLLVYFGYPVAQENDAERSARAGLAVIEAVTALESPVSLQVRVGIATGPVVVGDILGEGASEEAAVLGETPNLAARLQGAAVPNTVLLSPATQRLLRGRVETEALAPVELKGLSQPVAPYRAVRPRSLSEVSEARRDSTPLIGRDVEVALLERAWQHAQSFEGQAVLITGEPGVGKSRLLRAFQQGVKEDARIRVQWHCSPYYQTAANYPAIEQLRRSLGGDGLEAIETLVRDLGLDDELLVPPLALLLSIPLGDSYVAPDWSPEEAKRRLIQAQMELLRAAAERAPVLFLVEDLHWADPTTLEVLAEMISAIRTERVLLLMTARPEFSPPWADQSRAITQRLTSLSRNETIALVRGMVEEQGLSANLIEQIAERTDGVPLFVEELTKSLLESTEDAGVPASLQDSLMARLDRLGSTKELAQIASVIGRTFSLDALTPMAERTRDEIESALGELIDSGLVHRRGGTEYEFKHALIRDAAYDSMLRNTRRSLHGSFADHLTGAGQGQNEPAMLAQHYELAEKFDRACDFWTQAGRRSLERSAGEESVSHFEKALLCLSRLPDTTTTREATIDLNIQLGRGWQVFKGRQGGVDAFEKAVRLSDELGDRKRKAQALHGVCVNLSRIAPSRAVVTSEKLRELAIELDDPLTVLNAQGPLSTAHYLLGNFKQARIEAEKAVGIIDTIELEKLSAAIIGHPAEEVGRIMGMSSDALGLREQATKAMARVRDVSSATDRPYIICQSRIWSAKLMTWQRRYEEAYDFAAYALGVAQVANLGLWIGASKLFMGRALTAIEGASEGPGLMQEGIALWPSRAWLGEWHIHLAEALIEVGRIDEAAEALARGESFMSEIGAVHYAAECLRLKAIVAKLQGAANKDAAAAFVGALELARSQQARSFELNAAMGLAKLWQEQGETGRARDLLDPVYSGFTEGFDMPALKEAKALLKALY